MNFKIDKQKSVIQIIRIKKLYKIFFIVGVQKTTTKAFLNMSI